MHGGAILGNTVLIVDDAEFMRVMLREIIEDLGWSVAAEAADGHEAVAAWRQSRPDLILMDINMPNLDGTTALQAIVAEDPEARVVMIAALGQKNEVLRAIKAGRRRPTGRPATAAAGNPRGTPASRP